MDLISNTYRSVKYLYRVIALLFTLFFLACFLDSTPAKQQPPNSTLQLASHKEGVNQIAPFATHPLLNARQGQKLIPIDIEFEGGHPENLWVLFSDCGMEDHEQGPVFYSIIARFTKLNDRWLLSHTIHENQIEGGLSFPHSLAICRDGLLISDSGNKRAILIDLNGKILWDYYADNVAVNEALPILTPKGQEAFLFSENYPERCAITIISRSRKYIGSYHFGSKVRELHNPNVGPNGNIFAAATLLHDNQLGAIYEFTPDLHVIAIHKLYKISWPRNIQVNNDGQVLISHANGYHIFNRRKKLLERFNSEEHPMYNVARLPDGTKVACIYDRIVWISPSGQIERQYVYNEGSDSLKLFVEKKKDPELSQALDSHPYLKR